MMIPNPSSTLSNVAIKIRKKSLLLQLFACSHYFELWPSSLETAPHIIGMSIVGGLLHPLLVSLGLILWIIGRVLYQRGYAHQPDGRYFGGSLAMIGLFLSLFACIWTGLNILG